MTKPERKECLTEYIEKCNKYLNFLRYSNKYSYFKCLKFIKFIIIQQEQDLSRYDYSLCKVIWRNIQFYYDSAASAKSIYML